MRVSLLLLPLLLLGAVRPDAQVERVLFSDGGSTFVVRIQASGPFAAYGAPTVEGREMTLVLFNTKLSRRFRADAPGGPIAAFTPVQEGRHLKLVFTLKENVQADVVQDRVGNDLLLTLRPGVEPAPVSPPVVEAPLVRIDDVSRPVPLPKSTGARWRFDTVVIDAGHGGHDTGTRGNGLREKDITLAVARKVGQYVQENLGVKVVYTRTDDRFVTLRNRGRIANEAQGKLFVSIHVNSAPGASGRAAYGTETYFMGMYKNDAAKSVMERENSVVRLEEDPDAYADYDEEALILRTMANSVYLRKSERLAELVEGQFAGRVGRKSRGVKQAPFLVLWAASMPAVLVELGFLSNPEEARFLGSERGQDLLASAIFRSIRDLKAEYEHDLEAAADSR